MKPLMLFIILLLDGFELSAQDTIYARPALRPADSIMQLNNFFIDCAHGHICCDAHCRCCPWLTRSQCYDSIFHPVRNGIQRITVVERYQIAASFEKYTVHYIFRDKQAKLSRKWYRPDLNTRRHFDYRNDSAFKQYPPAAETAYLSSNRALVTDTFGEYHLIDLEGRELPMTFHTHREINPGIYISSIVVKDERIYGFSDGRETKIGTFCYTWIGPFDSHGFAVAKNTRGEFGLLNSKGSIILPFIYKDLKRLAEDRYSASLNGVYSLIDTKGRNLAVISYQHVDAYSEGLAFVKPDYNTLVYMDMNGHEVIRLPGKWGKGFRDGMAAIFNGKKWGYIDKSGKLQIDFQFDAALNFEQGAAPVAIGNDGNKDSWQLIDRSGKFITTKKYDEIESFRMGKARFFIRGMGYGMINTKGLEIFACQYIMNGQGTVNSWFINGKMIRKTVGIENSLELTDSTGKLLLSLSKYAGADFVADQEWANVYLPIIQVYKKNGMQNLLDLNGREICKQDYKLLSVYSSKIGLGFKNERWFLLDLETGKELKAFEQEEIILIRDGIIIIENKSKPYKFRYLDLRGQPIEVFEINI